MQLQNSSVGAHTRRLEKLKWKGLKKAPTALDDLDHELSYLVLWYERLRRQNPRNMDHEPISHVAMLAFSTLNGIEIDAFDLDTLEKLDAVWSNSLPKRTPTKT